MNRVVQRFQRIVGGSPADDLCLEPGTLADYRALASFHYRPGRPSAVTTVFRLVHRAPSVVGRFTQRKDETQTVAVLLRALPHLACSLRDVATVGRYRELAPREKALLLNREVRTLVRAVVHPQWRGLGLASRLVRHALAHPEEGTRYTEALAAMGQVHPFLERAGMTRFDRPPRPQHMRMLDVLARLDLEPTWLASPRAMLERIGRLDELTQIWFEHELLRWYRTGARKAKRRTGELPSMERMLATARDQLLTLPVYYVRKHT